LHEVTPLPKQRNCESVLSQEGSFTVHPRFIFRLSLGNKMHIRKYADQGGIVDATRQIAVSDQSNPINMRDSFP